jgi:hypothetical protein
MISPALLFPPLLQAYYPLTEKKSTKLMREKKTPIGKGEIV